MKHFILLLLLLASIAHSHEPAASAAKSSGLKVLVYSDTGYYRHPETPKINRWLVLLGHENGFEVDVTEHWKDMRAEELSRYDVLVLNNANELDKVLPEEQRKSVEDLFTKGGKGIVGLHAALVHQTKWPWLNALGGCDFNSDSDFSKAKVTIDPAAKDHPAVKGQPAEFWIEADWTNHDRSVTGQPGFNVLMRVDETTYTPVREYFKTRNGKPMGADHPIAWTHEPATGGRFFYTEFGHDLRSLSTPFARQHILEAIKWVAKKSEATASAAESARPVGEPFPVTIAVNAGESLGEMKPIWRFFGADEPNYAYLKEGKDLLGELGRLSPQQVFFRTHHLLTSGDGAYALKFGSTSAYKEDVQGNPIYDWSINDLIFDTYLECGVRPYVQLGFMPEALSSKPAGYPRNPPVDARIGVEHGFSFPPKDYVKWGNLAYEWAKHCRERYGQAEVDTWYWQVWNEPNIQYWQGTREEFFKLYDYAVDGIRRALPKARVGGPETAGGPGGTFLHDFLTHCARGTNHVTGKTGSPLDFVSVHVKGKPVFTEGHVRMAMSPQLGNIDKACALIASFPEFRQLPLILGESDPEGCAACRNPQDAYRNGTMYSSYTAASFPRKLEIAAKHGVNLEGVLTWAFTFVDQPPFAGFRQLSSAGLDLPVLNVFRMYAKMNGNRVAVHSNGGMDAGSIMKNNVRAGADVAGYASANEKQVAIMIWHYHDDDIPGPDAAVDVQLSGIPFPDGQARLTHYRIDAEHSNSYEAWRKMGSPVPIGSEQFAKLKQARQLAALGEPQSLELKAGKAKVKFNLPRQGVSLLVVEPK